MNCSSKQHFSGSLSESKNASSVDENKNGKEKKTHETHLTSTDYNRITEPWL